MIALILALGAFGQDTVTGGDVPEINGQLFRPALDSSGLLWTDETGVERSGALTGRFLLSYVNDPVAYVDGANRRTELVSDLFQLDLMGTYTWKRLRVGLDAPVYLRSVGEATGGETGLGDVAFDLRGTLLDRTQAPVGLALAGRTTLPTATVDGPLGAQGVGWELEGIADAELGEKWLLAFNAGTRGVPGVELENLDYDDQLFARLGGAYSITDGSGLGLELVSHLTYKALSQGEGRHAEAMLGGWHTMAESWVLRGGVGTGLGTGIGTPKLRVVAALAYEPPRRKSNPDLDGDGLVDDDLCPRDPEDVDGVVDADGCPEPTVVTVKVMEGEAEVAGSTWKLEKMTGSSGESAELFGGSYTLEAEADGYRAASISVDVPDAESHELVIQLSPEAAVQGTLLVSALDTDGKPVAQATWELDGTDHSGPAGDTTSLDPGEYHLIVRAPGYRPVERDVTVVSESEELVQLTMEPAKVEVSRERIDIKDSVYFETNRDVIKAESHSLLDEVAQLLRDHPELSRIRIEGHTDSRGDAAYNKDLSQRRAEAVRTYLIDKGVDADRMVAEGFGEEKPLRKEETPEAWSVNRRVDFFVVERED